MKRNEWLSRAECAALRGLAILGIMLHNYCHWLALAVKENEYTFNMGKSRGLWYVITHPDANLPVHIVSYFGHYGVPVFLFLSGFGLVMKYEQNATPGRTGTGNEATAWQFIRHHYAKLFTMMAAGFAFFALVDRLTPGAFRFHADNIIAQLLMLINLLPRPDRIIWPGPYWFFGLMMQLYIVYRLVLYRRSWRVAVALVAVCWLMQALCEPTDEALNRLRYNCIGGMLPFCAGVLLARTEPSAVLQRMARWHWTVAFLVIAAVAVAFCFSFQTWLWVPLLMVAASVAAVKSLPDGLLTPLVWTGGISAAMFVTHPTVRKVFIPISRRGDTYDGLVLYIVVAVAVAWMFNKLIKHKS